MTNFLRVWTCNNPILEAAVQYCSRGRDACACLRLHSCPSLAEAVSVKLVDRKEGQPLRRNRSRGEYLDGAALRRLRSHDEVEHDAHFAHYLDGLLDDLVAWKKRRVDYPALSTTA